jgi:hypothetical protein
LRATRFPDIYLETLKDRAMARVAQKRAVQNYRASLAERGLARFEVVARERDREIIRKLAKKLAEDGPEAERLRKAIAMSSAAALPEVGGIYEALRRSPLVGADLVFKRLRGPGRKVDL